MPLRNWFKETLAWTPDHGDPLASRFLPMARVIAKRSSLPKKGKKTLRRAAPKARTRRVQRQGNRPAGNSLGANVFSPYTPAVVPTPVNEGYALAVPGIVRVPINSSTANRKIFCFGNTGESSSVCLSVDNTASPGLFVWDVPTLIADANSGGPTSGRAMKFGIELVNTTAPINVTGNVYVLVSKQRFSLPAAPAAMTTAQWSTLASTIIAHPETKMYGSAHFLEPKSFFSYPVDDSQYHSYETWEGQDSAAEFMAHFTTWVGSTLANRPMAAIWLVTETAATTQNITATAMSSYYTRWPIGTVQAAIQQPVPTAPLAAVNQQSYAAQFLGCAGHAVSSLLGGLDVSAALQGVAAAGTMYRAMGGGAVAAAGRGFVPFAGQAFRLGAMAL